MLTPFDSLIDAIVQYSGYRSPSSAVYKARNPGGLKAYGPTAPRDAEGNRIFKSEIDGLQALKFDVRLKVNGKSKRKCDDLNALAAAYDQPVTAARAWALFIRQALGDNAVTPKTPLTYFMEQK